MQPDSLADDLLNHLYITHANMPRDERANAHWVMTWDWFTECRKIARPSLTSSFDVETILGIPVETRADGGCPHLEPIG